MLLVPLLLLCSACLTTASLSLDGGSLGWESRHHTVDARLYSDVFVLNQDGVDRIVMNAQEHSVVINAGLILDTIDVNTPIVYQDVDSWALTYFEDFDGMNYGDSWRWNSKSIQSCSRDSRDHFLGGFCKQAFGGLNTTVTLPDHVMIRVRARVHIFDSWAGDTLYLKVHDDILWTHHHKTCDRIFGSHCSGINLCGREDFSDELGVLVDVVFAHSGSELKLHFDTTLSNTTDSCVTSWAIDDVEVYTRK